MKSISLALLLLLVGCRTAAPQLLPTPTPIPEPKAIAFPPPPSNPVAPTPDPLIAQQVKRQRQAIEALISQNDALTAQLQAAEARAKTEAVVVNQVPPPALPMPTPAAIAAPVPPIPPMAPPPLVSPAVFVAPNADGVIDLAALSVPQGEPANPFAVRTLSADAMREITLRVGGIVGSPTPGAFINERLLLTGEVIESLTLERCEPDAAIFRRGEVQLRLPISAQPVRIRVAL